MKIQPTRYQVGYQPINVTIRVVLTKAMTAEAARLLLDRAVQTGRVPAGIEIRWIDWQRGEEGHVRTGHIRPAKVAQALRDFYSLLLAGSTRFEQVRS